MANTPSNNTQDPTVPDSNVIDSSENPTPTGTQAPGTALDGSVGATAPDTTNTAPVGGNTPGNANPLPASQVTTLDAAIAHIQSQERTLRGVQGALITLAQSLQNRIGPNDPNNPPALDLSAEIAALNSLGDDMGQAADQARAVVPDPSQAPPATQPRSPAEPLM